MNAVYAPCGRAQRRRTAKPADCEAADRAVKADRRRHGRQLDDRRAEPPEVARSRVLVDAHAIADDELGERVDRIHGVEQMQARVDRSGESWEGTSSSSEAIDLSSQRSGPSDRATHAASSVNWLWPTRRYEIASLTTRRSGRLANGTTLEPWERPRVSGFWGQLARRQHFLYLRSLPHQHGWLRSGGHGRVVSCLRSSVA